MTPAAHTRPRRRSRAVFGAAALTVVLAVAVVVGYAIVSNRSPSSPPEPTSAPPPESAPTGPVLEGVYRLNYDPSKRTTNGAATPGQPHPRDTSYWAFQSACGSAGCVSTGVGLDYDNPDVARSPAVSTTLGFVDGQWRDAPQPRQVNQPHCLVADGSVGPGSDTEASTWSMEPEPDGTLRGIQTATVITNECGNRGVVVELPLVATRVSDVPGGVSVADPTTATPPSLTNPTTPGPGPVLDGVYRIDLDFQSQTVDGAPAIRPLPNRSEWWAFRSTCDATGCVAASAQLVVGNLQQTTGVANALDFREGRWQDTPPTLQPPEPCSNGPDSDVSTVSWSLTPQPDGTLRGVGTRTILTDQCGLKNSVYKTPIVGERTGDVAATVVIADPTLLLTPE